jgi:hypothetical protein
MWFFKEKQYADCFVLNNTNISSQIDKKSLYDFIEQYFKTKYNFEFNHTGYISSRYKVYSGEMKKYRTEVINNIKELIRFDLTYYEKGIEYSIVEVNLYTSNINGITITLKRGKLPFDFFDFIFNINKFFKVEYGYYFWGPIEKQIMTFEAGDSEKGKYVNDATKTSKDDINSWRFNSEKINEGYFRDIFEINVLSERHINNLIEGITLKEIIKKKNIGNIEKIAEGVYFWKLNQKELVLARKIVYDANLIV